MLRDVLYSPNFSNLISGLRSTKRCSILERKNGKAVLKIEDKTVYQMETDSNGLWVKPDDLKNPTTRLVTFKINSTKLQELHERYGHLSFPALKKLPEAKDIPQEEFTKAECIACIKGKSTKPGARPSEITRTQEILERIHCDLIGPMETEWLGKKYVLTIIDDFSRYCIAIPIRAKSDTTEILKQAIKEMQLATGRRKVKSIQADWGGEFKNGALNSWCKSKGIIQKETVAHHSETNAVIERLNRTLQDITRTAMIGAELKGLWGDAIKWAAYTKNRIPHQTLTGMTPAQIFLLKEVPTRSNLRPFGQRVMIHIYKDQREGGRWAPRAQEARIIGFTETHGVYQVITPTGKRLISKNPRPIREEPEEINPTTIPGKPIPPPEKTKTNEPQKPRRSARSGRDTRPFNQREKEGLYGIPQVNKLRLIVNRVGHDEDHPTEQQVAEANQTLAKEWEEAREKERQKLRKYGVYSIVSRIPEGHRAVDTKWVYDVKRDKEGNLLRRRAKKVGGGFTQEYGKNYEDTHSQMARSETWRILLTLTIQYKWHVRQWDVVAAYLNAPLTHEVYVKDGEECWRLHKALYGLKQAGHEWYNTLKGIMNKSGLVQSVGDPGVFLKRKSIIIATHVDDMAAFSPNEEIITAT